MNIGLFKPGKKIFFKENEEDHASWSIEITNIIRILAEHGHKIYIMSDTDYDGDIENVFIYSGEKLNSIIVYCGLDINGVREKLSIHNCPIYLFATDLNLLPTDINQYTLACYHSKRFEGYIPLSENILYKANFTHTEIPEKTIRYYFGGTERDRLDDFLEYVHRPDCVWFGKSDFLGIKNYIPFHEHTKNMIHAKYSIVIGDKNYNAVGVITPRYYECIINNIVAFVDSKYDPDELYIKHDDFRRVSSYKELVQKMKILDENPQLYLSILKRQHEEITEDKKSGESLYTAIINKIRFV